MATGRRNALTRAKPYLRWRRAYLDAHPLCVLCEREGLVVAADELDHHPIPRSRGGALMDEGNVRSLCRPCHVRVSAEDLRTHGATLDGTPISRLAQGGRSK